MARGMYLAHTGPHPEGAAGTVPLRVLCPQATPTASPRLGAGRTGTTPTPTPPQGSKKELQARLVLSPISAEGGGVLHNIPLGRTHAMCGHLTKSPNHG